jgi:hypothetical protein
VQTRFETDRYEQYLQFQQNSNHHGKVTPTVMPWVIAGEHWLHRGALMR